MNKLPDVIIMYIFDFINPYLDHEVKYIKEKVISLEMYFLKQTSKLLNNIIELYYKLKPIFVINYQITNHYKNVINTLYYNEIAKIGNDKMFMFFNNFIIVSH